MQFVTSAGETASLGPGKHVFCFFNLGDFCSLGDENEGTTPKRACDGLSRDSFEKDWRTSETYVCKHKALQTLRISHANSVLMLEALEDGHSFSCQA